MAVENKVTQSVTTALNYLTRRVCKIASKEAWIYNIVILNKLYYFFCSDFHNFEVKRAFSVNDYCKIPKISPGAYIRRGICAYIWRGLYIKGLIFGILP